MESTTITLTGKSSNLSATIFPELHLDPAYNYSCALLDFATYNSIPNIIENRNNSLTITLENSTEHVKLCLDQGAYEIQDMIDCLMEKAKKFGVKLEIILNKNTYKVSFKSQNATIMLSNDSILPIFGFHQGAYPCNVWHTSETIVNITNITVIRIECDIIRGTYINSQPTHTIHQFSPIVAPGFKIVEAPKNIIYLPLAVNSIQSVHISLVDQDGTPIDLQGETVTCRIHIKRNT